MKVKLTLTEQKKVKAFAKRLVENRKRSLTEGFKRDALNAIDEAKDVFEKLREVGFSDEELEKLQEFVYKKCNMYDHENQEFAAEALLYSENFDEDELLNDMEDLGIRINNRYGTEQKMVIDCLLDAANAIDQFLRKRAGQ